VLDAVALPSKAAALKKPCPFPDEVRGLNAVVAGVGFLWQWRD
jgi:hypothetical protein